MRFRVVRRLASLAAPGSYNWTQSAEHANYENLVVLDEPEVIDRFQRKFGRLWREAKV